MHQILNVLLELGFSAVAFLLAPWGLLRKANTEVAGTHQASPLLQSFREFQTTYWQPNPAEQHALLEKGIEALGWPECLRLLHLLSVELQLRRCGTYVAAASSTDRTESDTWKFIVQLAQKLQSVDSPYRSHIANVRQRGPATLHAMFPSVLINASCTHHGCIEVIRLDAQQNPLELEFIPFARLRQVVFMGSVLNRFARLTFRDDRPDEVVFVPPIYGISWMSSNKCDRDGTFTWFIRPEGEIPAKLELAIGVGQQDFKLFGIQPGIVGIASILQIRFVTSAEFQEQSAANGAARGDG